MAEKRLLARMRVGCDAGNLVVNATKKPIIEELILLPRFGEQDLVNVTMVNIIG